MHPPNGKQLFLSCLRPSSLQITSPSRQSTSGRKTSGLVVGYFAERPSDLALCSPFIYVAISRIYLHHFTLANAPRLRALMMTTYTSGAAAAAYRLGPAWAVG